MSRVILNALRLLGKNISTLLLAILMAVFVWFSAVIAADPNEQREYPQLLEVEIFGQDAGMVLVNDISESIRVTIKAPRSIWSQLETNPELIRVWIDLTGLTSGEYIVPIKTQIGVSPHQIIKVDPVELHVILEPLSVNAYPVQVVTNGDPNLGYRKGSSRSDPSQATVSGPVTEVSKVVKVIGELNITGSSDRIRKVVTLKAVDKNGDIVQGITISPQVSTITQEISLLGGYRNVVVKVITEGQVAEGYWLTNISVTPPNVTVFSTDTNIINSLPGYVETETVDLTGLSDDIDVRVNLNLVDNVELAGEESVLVRLSIAAIEGSLPISMPIVIVGLPPELSADVSPQQVDLLITGPLPLLNNLKPGGIRIVINLTGLGPGTHQVKPEVDLLPNQVQVASILPESVEVVITWTTAAQLTSTALPILEVTPTP